MRHLWKGIMIVLFIAIFVLSLNAFINIFNRDDTTHMVTPIGLDSTMGNETEYWAVVIVAFNETPAIYPYIYDALISSNTMDPTHIKLLYRENATRDAIIDSIEWLRDNADSNDFIIFADNSHGTVEGGYLTGQYGIVPWDYNTTGLITVAELDTKFDEIRAKGMCLIFDCCLAGNFIDGAPVGITKLTHFTSFRKHFTAGIEGDNRVVLVATMKYGLGFHASIIIDNYSIDISFSRFLSEGIKEKIDNNNDKITSAEEIFFYAQKKMRPYAFSMLLLIRRQIQTFLSTGFFILGFPQIFDGYPGELPLVIT